MTHPDGKQLALFAGGEMNFVERWWTERHIRRCSACSAAVDGFLHARNQLRMAAEDLPAHIRWDRLAAEMTGNIRVGLAAGECVAPVGSRSERLGWRPAAVLAAMSLLVLTAWWINIPYAPHAPPEKAQIGGAVLQETSAGIQLQENGSALTLIHAGGARTKPLFVSSPGSLRSRYVDSETGQVTINHVYVD